MLREFNFAKVMAVLAVVFGVSLGLCGLTAVVASAAPPLAMLGALEMAAMLLSLLGMIVVGLAWLVATIAGGGSSDGLEFQKLFDDERDGKSE